MIINLGAQANVRHSLKDPYTYINSNLLGHVNMLELAKKNKVKKFIYAVHHQYMEVIKISLFY